MGDHSSQTLQKLIDRTDPDQENFYFTDHYNSYAEILPANRLRQGKAHTHGIERNNGLQRHWLARFKRRSIVVSKSLSMIDVSMTLFAHFQDPQNLPKLIALL